MLRKIDCVMVRVDDLDAGVAFYAEALGLRPLWRDETSVGMAMPETDAEIVLHTTDLEYSTHYLVDDVRAAAQKWQHAIRTAPFEIAIGWCAVLDDPFGNPICILDMTKGQR
ncbi:VOC family protein [Actinoplanes sp. NPDC051513]|uniref:VOC family protein n=1 Tax=Actinoplanes sp. NPDC051513 TaxID=3363908 RepID=UPI0037969D8D